jgi:formamidopyrimidine-DNA glycosylase
MMPEGPEVKHLASSIDTMLGGGRYALTQARIVSGRYAEGAPPKGWEELNARLPREIERCGSRGKFMYWLFGDGCSLWSTLGLTGWWSADPRREHTRVVLTAAPLGSAGLDNERAKAAIPLTLGYADMRNFGTLRFSTDRAELEAKLASLGAAWLDGECEWEAFQPVVQRTVSRYPNRPVAVFLMDQKKTAGIGNYILSESLYRARVHPFATCGALDMQSWATLHAAIADVMRESYASQGRSWRADFGMRVYSCRTDPEGRYVVRAEGPHKRAVWFVPDLQVIGMPAEWAARNMPSRS